MTSAIPRSSSPRATLLLSGLVVILLFVFLYWGYPFDGMMISDSWFLYVLDGGEFKWWTRAQLLDPEPVLYRADLPTFTPTWSLLHTRRGLMPIAVWLIDRVSFGNRQVAVNILCLLVQILNAGLFAYIIRRIAGPRLFVPIFICAVLYPFSSGSHFWQYIIINNLAVTFFLASLAAFLCIDHTADALTRGHIAWGIVSMVCFWISIMLVDYAVFMGPLFLYLALYYNNSRQALFRFPRFLTPSVYVALAFLVTNALAVIFIAQEAPSVLAYGSRFEELASRTVLPTEMITVLAVFANTALFYLSAVFSNSFGYVLHPLSTVKAHYGILFESPWIVPGIGFVAATGAFALYAVSPGQRVASSSEEKSLEAKFVLVVGVMWTVLAYLPFAMAIGYPRIVGLTADRANILALWGVSTCIGLFLHKLLVTVGRGNVVRVTSLYGGVFIVLAVLISNLYIQKEYYVENYRKERELARLILESEGLYAMNGRLPIILLDRKEKLTFPRAQLMAAVEQPGEGSKILGLLRFLANRYFIQEYVTSSFHLGGIMMFGCCPNSAWVTFDGYAKWLNRRRVPVYKHEPPFYLEQNDGVYKIGYKVTEAWSKSFGSFRSTTFPKRQYQIIKLEIGDSFFRLRGGLDYNVSAYAGDQPD